MTQRDPKTGRFPKGNGSGWGGSAKGASTSRVKPAGDEDSDTIRALRWDGEHMAAKEEVAAQMRGVLYHVALNGEAEAARINAADKLLDRIEGKPVVKQDIKLRGINPDTMTDEELAAIAAGGSGGPAATSDDPA